MARWKIYPVGFDVLAASWIREPGQPARCGSIIKHRLLANEAKIVNKKPTNIPNLIREMSDDEPDLDYPELAGWRLVEEE